MKAKKEVPAVDAGVKTVAKGALLNTQQFWRDFLAAPMPHNLAFKFMRYSRDVLNVHLELIDKGRSNIAKKHAGDLPKVPKEKLNEFTKEFNEFLNESIEMPFVDVTLEELEAATKEHPGFTVSPATILVVSEYFKSS